MSSKSATSHSPSPLGLSNVFGVSRAEAAARRQAELRQGGTSHRIVRAVGAHALGLFAIFLITQFYRHEPLANVTTVGFTFLLAVLVAAAVSGFGPSLLMSLVATLCFDYYFIPPVGTWNITDSRDWVALTAFVITAVVGSSLSTLLKRQTRQARQQRHEAEQLYNLSQRLLEAGDSLALCNAMPQDMVDAFGVRAVALLLAESQTVFYSAGASHQFDAAQLKASLENKAVRIDDEANISYLPLRLGIRVVGTLGIVDPALSFETLEAISSLLTIAIERARAIEEVGKIEALKESERLKSALLDAITHEFRTPLTAMKISVSGMLSDMEFDREQCHELLTMIDEGCDRIDHLVEEVSQMSRLETGDVKLELDRHSVGELIDSALADCRPLLGSRPIERGAANEDVRLRVDLFWATKILAHLIANANLYSTPGQPITIRTETSRGLVIFSVADRGPGIDPADLSRLFEKFYRGKEHRCRVQGTGMGLPISKAITEAHGGTMRAASRAGEGSVFSFTLPIDRSLE